MFVKAQQKKAKAATENADEKEEKAKTSRRDLGPPGLSVKVELKAAIAPEILKERILKYGKKKVNQNQGQPHENGEETEEA